MLEASYSIVHHITGVNCLGLKYTLLSLCDTNCVHLLGVSERLKGITIVYSTEFSRGVKFHLLDEAGRVPVRVKMYIGFFGSMSGSSTG